MPPLGASAAILDFASAMWGLLMGASIALSAYFVSSGPSSVAAAAGGGTLTVVTLLLAGRRRSRARRSASLECGPMAETNLLRWGP